MNSKSNRPVLYRGDENRLLGWHHIVAALSDRTRTVYGSEAATEVTLNNNNNLILQNLNNIEKMRALHRTGEQSPLGAVPDIRPALKRVAKEGILDGSTLRELALLLRTASETSHFLRKHREILGELTDKWPHFGGDEPLARKIEKSIDPSGEVTDEASPEVAESRFRIRNLHARLRRTAEDMTRSRNWADKLQEPYFSVRGDRYVLPVKAAWRYQVGGIVHNVSNTGETVFIEPPDLIDIGNELAVALAEEEEAVRMVLAELTRLAGNRADSIHADISAISEIDKLEASARLADDLNASMPKTAEGPDALFNLKGLRHPILVLQGKKVIENNVSFQNREKCLVVSGPNAGGKTVTITAIALSAIMLKHGLPIPAEPGSIMPIYKDVLAVLGDEQDLEKDLSTFSAHLESIRHVLEKSGPMCLVMIDEICADTDPREGSALAGAILEKLVDNGADILVTTHFEALKVLAAANPRYLAAAMGFDHLIMQPTYRLRLHVSGGSSAIEIAEKTGLPEDIIKGARAHLGGDGGALSNALESLEKAISVTENERETLRSLQEKTKVEQEKLVSARALLDEERRKIRSEARASLIEEIEEARNEVKKIIAKLQAEPAMRKAAETEKMLDKTHDEAITEQARDEESAYEEIINKEGPDSQVNDGKHKQNKKKGASSGKDENLKAGTFVRAPALGDREGEIIEADEKDALVAFGALKMRMPIERLVPLKRHAAKAVKSRIASTKEEKKKKAEKMMAAPLPEDMSESVIDLRGMRTDDAVALLDKRLDDLLGAGAGRVRIIHGHGTGALRKAVREHLAISPHVAGTEIPPPEDGGDGATWVRLV